MSYYSKEEQKVINDWLASVGAPYLANEDFFEYRRGQLLEIANAKEDSLLTWDEWQHLQVMMDMEIPLKMSIRFVGILYENDVEVLEMSTDKSKKYEDNWEKRLLQEEKNMYTFEFTYDESVDDFGSIQFCAKTRTEAETLFKEWREVNGLKINEYDVKVVYVTCDAQEYGDDYMPCVDLGLMKNGANTVWCDEDISTALMDIGIEPSAENIRKVATKEFIKGFHELMIQRGNEIIHQEVSELFDEN